MSAGMKMDEEFGPDRGIEVETDDEENEAERDCEDGDENDDDSESDSSPPPSLNNIGSSTLVSGEVDLNSPSWPQSYSNNRKLQSQAYEVGQHESSQRLLEEEKSMDMYTSVTPPPISFLKGSSMLSSSDKRSQHTLPISNSALSKPLISTSSWDYRDDVSSSSVPVKFSAASFSRFASVNELLPPPSAQCSYSQSVLNAINALCGIGLLSTPYAFKEGGWFTLLLLLLLSVITCYTGILLKNCLESSHELQTYPDIGQAAFGSIGRVIVAIILYIELYSSCVEYLIMMSDNLAALFPHVQIEFAGIYLNSYQFWAIISTLIILPTVWLRNLSLLSYISVGGVVTLGVVVVCLLWVGVVDNIGYHPSGTAQYFANLPVAVGLIGFCYGSHSVFPNIYSSMKEPSRFPSVLGISFLISWFLYTAVGIYGYTMFGDNIKSQFTLNMPTKFVASRVAAWTVVVAPVTKYALTITPVAFGLEELLPAAKIPSYGVSIFIRTYLVVSTLVVALIVPYFGVVMALIGSLLVMLVSVIFPCVCYLSILRGRLTKSKIIVCVLIIAVGLICSTVGTYSALNSIAENKKA